MRYGGALILAVPEVKGKATAKKAVSALKRVKGVANVTVFPPQGAVGISFTSTGKVTSKQLLGALEKAGLKASQYDAGR